MPLDLEGFLDFTPLLRAGVYALCKRGVVIYVGKSKSLYARIYTHKHFANRGAKGRPIPDWLPVKGIQFDEVFIRTCSLEDLAQLEARILGREAGMHWYTLIIEPQSWRRVAERAGEMGSATYCPMAKNAGVAPQIGTENRKCGVRAPPDARLPLRRHARPTPPLRLVLV